MALKVVFLATLVAVSSAGFIPAVPAAVEYQQVSLPAHITYHASPVAYAHATPVVGHKTINPEDDPHPQYSYAYDVQDAISDAFITQREIPADHVAYGNFSFIEALGIHQIVDDTADLVNGSNAVAHKEVFAQFFHG